MENVSDALLLSSAVLILVVALATTMNVYSKARETSDIVISTVESGIEQEYEETVDSGEYRIVGLETIIPNLYRYYKEDLTIAFMQGNYNGTTHELSGVSPLKIYESKTDESDWDISYKGDSSAYPVKKPSYGLLISEELGNKKYICTFDIAEENARHEPFITKRKENIDAILKGTNISYWYRENVVYDYSSNNPLTNSANKYIEIISREDKNALQGNKTTRKSIITYIKI